jgi:hypothetical protein
MTLSVAQTVWCWMLRWQWIMNWKWSGRKQSYLVWGTIPAFAWKHWGKQHKTSVRIVGVLAEIQTGHLPDTNQKWSQLTQYCHHPDTGSRSSKFIFFSGLTKIKLNLKNFITSTPVNFKVRKYREHSWAVIYNISASTVICSNSHYQTSESVNKQVYDPQATSVFLPSHDVNGLCRSPVNYLILLPVQETCWPNKTMVCMFWNNTMGHTLWQMCKCVEGTKLTNLLSHFEAESWRSW